jgi:hypothetical protein
MLLYMIHVIRNDFSIIVKTIQNNYVQRNKRTQ